MTKFREWLQRLKATFQSQPLDARTSEEMRFHIEMATEDGLNRGLSPADAERQARLRAGSELSAREAVRDQRGLPWLDDFVHDVRIAARGLARRRGFAAITITALTLAVAINTVIYALVNGVLLQPLPYEQPERLVRLFESSEQFPKFPISAALFLETVRDNRVFENLALYTGEDLQLTLGDRPQNLSAVRVSHQFFPTLGVQPILGRNFTEDEMEGSPRVVLLSHALWTSRFDQDPEIVGRSIRLNRENWTVIGVLPAGFEHVGGAYRSPLQGETVALWWPVNLKLADQGMYQWHFMNAVARLKPAVSIQQAREDFGRLMVRHQERYPDGHSDWHTAITKLEDEVVGGSRQTVLLLLVAGGVVLLIACANIAGLCVARGLARRREMAIRQALGARAGRLVRAWAAENLLLGAAGGVAGLALAAALVPVLRAILPSDFPRLHAVQFGPAVAAFAILSAVATALIAGLLPALRQTRRDPREALHDEPRGTSAGHGAQSLRSFLVGGEVALAALLCAATLLLARSAGLLDARDHGFAPDHALTFRLSLPQAAYSDQAAHAQLYVELARRWRQIPGVAAAGLATDIPWTGYDENSGFRIVGREGDAAEGSGRYHAASPGYFEALHVPLLLGRSFNEHDVVGAPLVAVINDTLAKRYLPGENPVGQVLRLWGREREVIGVVADIRDRPSDPEALPAYWFPLAQERFSELKVVLRTSGDPLAIAPAAGAALNAVDAELPMADIHAMDAIANAALAERRFALWLFEAFAVLALALAAVGIYGLLAYLVEQRRKEFGIRMALGANRTRIVRMVVGDGVRVCAIGAVAGLTLVPLLGSGLASFLYGVGPTDAGSLSAACLIILGAAAVASFIPAWSAAGSQPTAALRDE